MIGKFPALVLGRFGPLFTRIFGADLQSHTGSVVELHADFVDNPAPDHRPLRVFQTDFPFPGQENRLPGYRLDEEAWAGFGVLPEELASETERVGLSSNPRHPEPQSAVAMTPTAGRLEVVRTPAINASGDLFALIAFVVDVVAGQQQAVEQEFAISQLFA